MTTLHMTATVGDDRTVVLRLPAEVPVGEVDLAVTVTPKSVPPKPPRTSLADWAEANAEDWGDVIRSDDVEGFTGRRF
ncbi:MAG TPA: hypothetical protein VGF55_15500 [Gemmataceae bacterium]|jgi:hypothetical protein